MTRLPLLVIPLLIPLAGALACANDVARERAPQAEIGDETQAVFAVPTEVDTERVYLGDTNLVDVTEDAPWVYGLVDLAAGARIGIELSTTDGYADWIGFKVYKVTSSGGLQLLGVVDGEGYASAILRSTSGGSFVVQATNGAWLPSTLALDLTCLKQNGRCAAFAQPGEACGSLGHALCDDGLMCRIEAGCGRADEGGTCERPVEMCPAVVGAPVCGCDGNTYDGACKALAAGVNVDFAGPCACDPTIFTKVTDGFVDVTGAWLNSGIRHDGSNFEISSRLALLADGTYAYEQVHTPLCALNQDPEQPVCRMASLLFTSAGTWENQGFAVQLFPDANGSPDELAQSFGIATSCEGAVQLDTVEMGHARVLERDPCSDTVCLEGERCELVQVQCIRAPCPAQPTCVAE